MRLSDGRFLAEGDGTVIEARRVLDVWVPDGRLLVQHGYEMVFIRRVRPGG
jgi:hypothetical protein